MSEISIPPAWLLTYPAIFRPSLMSSDESFKSVILSTVESVALTEVVLAAKHEDAYIAASVYGTAFEDWFFDTQIVIRTGEDIFIPSSIFACGSSMLPGSLLFGYTVNLALPYKQGVAHRGMTRFIVTSCNEVNVGKAESHLGHEHFEINESFLVSAVLSSPEPLETNVNSEH